VALGLLSRQDFAEVLAKWIEIVGSSDMEMEAGGVELREDVDSSQTGIDAVADGDVYETIFAAEGYRGFRPIRRKGVEPRPFAAAKYNAEYICHDCPLESILVVPRTGVKDYAETSV
jgi:hypothetical protein